MKDLKNQLNKGWTAAKEGARDIAIEAGLAEPTIHEQAQKGIRNLAKGVREEFGAPKGLMEKLEEAATSLVEKLEIKEPRVGKSLVEVIKSAFGMLASITGTAKEQNAASEKFDKACETFSKAMTALFKTKEKGHHKDTKATATPPKHKAAGHRPEKSAAYQSAVGRHEAREGSAKKNSGGRGR
jgi:hypothetical protein